MLNEFASPIAEKILSCAWNSACDAMVVVDSATGIWLEVNPAAERMTGYSRAELIGKHLAEFHPDADAEWVLEILRLSPSSAAGVYEGHRIRRQDGVLVPVSLSASAALEDGERRLVVVCYRDVSDVQSRERRLEIKRWALRAYGGAALALARAHSSVRLMQEICEAITRESIYVLATVGMACDDEEKSLHFAGVAGPARSYTQDFKLSWDENKPEGQGPAGIALRTGQVFTIEDTETTSLFEPWRERARKVGIRSSITVPFQVFEGAGKAILMVYSSRLNAFGPVETEAFTHLATEIGIGLHGLAQAERLEVERNERERVQKELARALSGVVGAITTAMEARDPYTAGHQYRVSILAVAMAQKLDWPEERIEALRVAAMVHDIGKMAVPEEILNKTGKFSAEEWSLIQQHCEAGYSILKGVPFRWPIAETVLQHHERLDGSGYPYGLKEGEILDGAQIIAIADIVESMASARPYRAALGIDAALAEIESMAGEKLDTRLVAICLRLFREEGFVLPIVAHV